jgi:low affinity Fe/Cu permease
MNNIEERIPKSFTDSNQVAVAGRSRTYNRSHFPGMSALGGRPAGVFVRIFGRTIIVHLLWRSIMKVFPAAKGFQSFAVQAARLVGSSGAFLTSVVVIAVWALSGHYFGYSDTWQLWINTGTTIVTFLMVFLIQYTQNRDARAMHLKLDELLRAVQGARTEMVDLKDFSDEELARLERAFERLARFAARPRVVINTGTKPGGTDEGH